MSQQQRNRLWEKEKWLVKSTNSAPSISNLQCYHIRHYIQLVHGVYNREVWVREECYVRDTRLKKCGHIVRMVVCVYVSPSFTAFVTRHSVCNQQLHTIISTMYLIQTLNTRYAIKQIELNLLILYNGSFVDRCMCESVFSKSNKWLWVHFVLWIW